MSKHGKALLVRGVRSGGNPSSSTPRRINVAVSPDMLVAIDRVIEREKVTLTEAVRRLITYGDFVYQTTKIQGGTLVVRLPDGIEKEVVLV